MAPRTSYPQPPNRLPVIGDLLSIQRKYRVQSISRITSEQGGLCEFSVFGYRILAVSDAALIKDLDDDNRFEKHVDRLFGKLRPLTGDGLFTVDNDNPKWEIAPTALTPAFDKKSMQGYHAPLAAVCQELKEYLVTASQEDRCIDVPDVLNRTTMEIIARTGFHHTFGSIHSAIGVNMRMSLPPGAAQPILNPPDAALTQRVAQQPGHGSYSPIRGL